MTYRISSDMNKYFKRREFACKCDCGMDTVDAELLEILTEVREHFGKPVVITSGNRCTEHNASIGGAPKSLHTLSRAADFKVRGIDSVEVFKWLTERYSGSYGIGLYSSWVHVDSRAYEARW